MKNGLSKNTYKNRQADFFEFSIGGKVVLVCPTLEKDMKRSLKIFVVGIFLTLIVVGLALLRFWISSLESLPLMSLDFLNGRAIAASIESDPRKSPFAVTRASGPTIYHSWIQWYSFQADFSDLCKAADAELLNLGFTARTHSRGGYRYRIYMLNKANSVKTVVIQERQRLVKYSIADGCTWENEDGWVTVRISRGWLPFWPPRYLLYRLKRHLQAAGLQKP